jgi:hypothetical protein
MIQEKQFKIKKKKKNKLDNFKKINFNKLINYLSIHQFNKIKLNKLIK